VIPFSAAFGPRHFTLATNILRVADTSAEARLFVFAVDRIQDFLHVHAGSEIVRFVTLDRPVELGASYGVLSNVVDAPTELALLRLTLFPKIDHF
jgi:hypothetical protein